jgi:hypothetical protein
LAKKSRSKQRAIEDAAIDIVATDATPKRLKQAVHKDQSKVEERRRLLRRSEG